MVIIEAILCLNTDWLCSLTLDVGFCMCTCAWRGQHIPMCLCTFVLISMCMYECFQSFEGWEAILRHLSISRMGRALIYTVVMTVGRAKDSSFGAVGKQGIPTSSALWWFLSYLTKLEDLPSMV